MTELEPERLGGESREIVLSVSIVCFCESVDQLRVTLLALAEAQADANALPGQKVRTRLTLIDNSPREQCLPAIDALLDREKQCVFESIETIALAANPGFGAGNNQAIRAAESDFHLILNPDAELNKKSLAVGLEYLRGNRAAVAVSPRVYGPGGKREYLARSYPSVLVLMLRGFAPRWLRRLFIEREQAYELRETCRDGVAAAEVPLASGCCLLARTRALHEINGFDEAYFLYFEDYDLCLRLGGLGSIVYLAGMEVIHRGGYAARKGWRHRFYFMRSGCRFFSRHGWRWL